MNRYQIAVDFDGVLHAYTSPWQAEHRIPDGPVSGAIPWLNRIVHDYDVIIHTTRGATQEGRVAIRVWLAEQGYTGPALEVTDVKPPALIYLDDRAIRFTGANWPTADDVRAAQPWNKT